MLKKETSQKITLKTIESTPSATGRPTTPISDENASFGNFGSMIGGIEAEDLREISRDRLTNSGELIINGPDANSGYSQQPTNAYVISIIKPQNSIYFGNCHVLADLIDKQLSLVQAGRYSSVHVIINGTEMEDLDGSALRILLGYTPLTFIPSDFNP